MAEPTLVKKWLTVFGAAFRLPTGFWTMFFTESIGCPIERFRPSAKRSPLLVSTSLRMASASTMRFLACGTPTASKVPKSLSMVK